MKKRYNKLIAYLLMDFSTVCVVGILAGLILLMMGKSESIFVLLTTGAFCLIPTFLLTLYINRRTPKGERVGTWLRAWWLGFRISFKIALCCTLILIPAMLKWSIEISENDLSNSSHNWYDERKRVYDDNDNEYDVGRSGDYVKDANGDWQKVNRDRDGDPYIGSGSNKTWLK